LALLASPSTTRPGSGSIVWSVKVDATLLILGKRKSEKKRVELGERQTERQREREKQAKRYRGRFDLVDSW
jgi:hypothetical protein